MRLALNIEYKGTSYYGWQLQKTHKEKTLQYHVDKAISKVADEKIITVCAGRTDTGVHATGQVVHFDTEKKRLDLNWIRGINSFLPNDIYVNAIYHVDKKFHARYSALSRTYRYIIFNNEYASPILRDYSLHFQEVLDLEKIKKSFLYLKGEHDFTSFQGAGCSSKNPVKEITKINLKKSSKLIYIDITSNSFLYHMVRNIIGTLLDIGIGKYSPSSLKKLIQLKDRKYAGKMVSASGLYLMKVNYPKIHMIDYKTSTFF